MGKKKGFISKQILSIMLGMALMLTCLPINASAEEVKIVPTEIVTVFTEPVTISNVDQLSNDELFGAYVEQYIFGMGGNITTFAMLAGDRLQSDAEKNVYQALKTKISEIAENGGSSQFELDVTGMGVTFNHDSRTYNIDISKILHALLTDCAYELYWFDKTIGIDYELGMLPDMDGEVSKVVQMKVTLYVAQEYQGGSSSTVSDAKVDLAKTARDNADKVIAEAKQKTGLYDKLVYFLDYIKGSVDYGEIVPSYGDPWQMIWVFDGDESTDVVCEGYAKAFKYLCDGIGVECYTVSGDMIGATGQGAHMWNIVVLDDKSYLVDPTSCDENAVGYPYNLFLKAPTSGSGTSDAPYLYQIDQSNFVKFIYDAETVALFEGTDILTLATEDYSTEGDNDFADGMGELTDCSLSLGGNIAVNFRMRLDDAVADSDTAKMVFTLGNGTTKEIMVKSVEPDESNYYVFSCDVAAKEMADDIKAQIVMGEQLGTEYTYSVKSYADYILGHASEYPSVVPLVKAMLNYGAYSQTYFNYHTENLANAGLGETPALSEVTVDSLSEFAAVIDKEEEVCTFDSAYLTLKSETKVTVNVRLAEGVTGAEFFINGEKLDDVKYDQSEGCYVMIVDGIKAQLLDKMHEFKVSATVNGSAKEATLNYGALSYCRSVLGKDYEQNLKNVVAALRLFNVAADAYIK